MSLLQTIRLRDRAVTLGSSRESLYRQAMEPYSLCHAVSVAKTERKSTCRMFAPKEKVIKVEDISFEVIEASKNCSQAKAATYGSIWIQWPESE